MNPEAVALLRADSLAATLTAARGRRSRRRASTVALACVICAVVALSLAPRRPVAPAVITAAAPTFPPRVHLIHTAPDTVAKITTRESASAVRFRTAPTALVERIDTAGLARCFPDKGIAVIQPKGELAKVVFF